MIKCGKYAYLDQIYPKAKVIFENYNFELWNFTHLSKFKSSDNETIDGFHAGELAYIKMLIYMIKNNSIIRNHTNLKELEKDTLNKRNRYIVYD